jgi:hypothetical protein
MKKWFLLLVVLAACVSEQPPVPAPVEKVVEKVPDLVVPQLKSEPATRTVKQTGSLGTFVYGLTEDNRLVRIEKTGAVWEYHYENGRLAEITGPQNIEFLYVQGKLSAIDTETSKLIFKYDSRDRLVEVKGGKETLYIDYDTIDRIHQVRRGVAGATGFVYDDKNFVKTVLRGPIETPVFFDDRNRVRNFDADDTKFIIGYWRDDKVISLTGKTFGRGVAVSYGPDYPPFEADIIYAEDDSRFTSAYTDTLYKITDEYVYCKYVRRLKDLLFEGLSFVFYENYFKGGLAGYFAMQFACIPYEA